MESGISLSEYVAAVKADLELFEKYWREQEAKQPEDYSQESMNRADWDEQFDFVIDLGV